MQTSENEYFIINGMNKSKHSDLKGITDSCILNTTIS